MSADRASMLSRRRIGIALGFVAWQVLALLVLLPSVAFRWERGLVAAAALSACGVGDPLRRSWTTWRRSGLVGRGPTTRAHVTLHHRRRHRIPDLEVAGLWPAGVVQGQDPPLSVRLESVGPPLREGAEVLVHGELRPGAWVVLQAGDELVWPLRKVRRGLKPNRLEPHPPDEGDGDEGRRR